MQCKKLAVITTDQPYVEDYRNMNILHIADIPSDLSSAHVARIVRELPSTESTLLLNTRNVAEKDFYEYWQHSRSYSRNADIVNIMHHAAADPDAKYFTVYSDDELVALVTTVTVNITIGGV